MRYETVADIKRSLADLHTVLNGGTVASPAEAAEAKPAKSGKPGEQLSLA